HRDQQGRCFRDRPAGLVQAREGRSARQDQRERRLQRRDRSRYQVWHRKLQGDPKLVSRGRDGARLHPASCDTATRSEEHTSELQSRENLVCRLLLEKKKNIITNKS